jgi:hypothetical protein
MSHTKTGGEKTVAKTTTPKHEPHQNWRRENSGRDNTITVTATQKPEERREKTVAV